MNTMNRTRRAIGLSALVILAVLGTAWAMERSAHPQTHPTTIESTRPSDVAPVEVQPAAASPAVEPEYDRSDLLLSQG